MNIERPGCKGVGFADDLIIIVRDQYLDRIIEIYSHKLTLSVDVMCEDRVMVNSKKTVSGLKPAVSS